jgi:hypothetical protein
MVMNDLVTEIISDIVGDKEKEVPVNISYDFKTAVVGLENKNDNMGCAYIIKKNPTSQKWEIEQEINGKVTGGQFGSSVAINGPGNKIIIGACGEQAAYVYEHYDGKWAKVVRLEGPEDKSSAYGFEVDISANGNIVAVSAPEEDLGQGAVYVYDMNDKAYQLLARIVEPKATSFGYTVYLNDDGGQIAIGTPYGDVFKYHCQWRYNIYWRLGKK